MRLEVGPDRRLELVAHVENAVTTAPAQVVHGWAGELEPDAPDEGSGWIYADPPPGAPPVPDGHSVVALRWD